MLEQGHNGGKEHAITRRQPAPHGRLDNASAQEFKVSLGIIVRTCILKINK
jgi:hypothetical protein